MSNFIPAILLVILLVGGTDLSVRLRAAAMSELASKLKFRFTPGPAGLWGLWFPPKDGRPLPTTFPLRGDLLIGINRTWNVIEGEKDGINVLIFDSVRNLGMKSGTYSTIIATRGETDYFKDKSEHELIVHSNGWTILGRFRFWQILPWTLSIRRIEEHLNSFGT
ncbi:MAG TPA: hypothetical protein VGU46_12590 [Acidobacteriaceae bacterium]|nr:hypothetical protein [Acidobacteriaceae bacterium]